MDVLQAIQERRSVKRFRPDPVPREIIEQLLDTVVLAPNHRMTQPWGFIVMGPEARRSYAEVLAGRRARKALAQGDDAAAEAVRAKTLEDAAAIPAMLAVTTTLAEDPEIREEDYAATMMGVQNLLLAAHALGLGTHLKTGAIMGDPELRSALGTTEGERTVALIQLGVPAELPSPKPRARASERTRWLP